MFHFNDIIITQITTILSLPLHTSHACLKNIAWFGSFILFLHINYTANYVTMINLLHEHHEK